MVCYDLGNLLLNYVLSLCRVTLALHKTQKLKKSCRIELHFALHDVCSVHPFFPPVSAEFRS